ncbi:MAG: hypothetical protein CM15mP103_06790 [Gammaproteobacteria bacterium]|nr:MAG: hypothetical protein CM15mP103_06790 [Gammaproteobacteria bacterium]
MCDFGMPLTRQCPARLSQWIRASISIPGVHCRAAIDNSADRFRPGMAFEISINASRGAFLSVPDVAVQWGADGAYVWVAEQGRAARRKCVWANGSRERF